MRKLPKVAMTHLGSNVNYIHSLPSLLLQKSSRLNLKAINFIFLDNNRHHRRCVTRRESMCVVCLQLQSEYMQNIIGKNRGENAPRKKKYHTHGIVCACFSNELLLFFRGLDTII